MAYACVLEGSSQLSTEVLISAVAGDLASRFISFLAHIYDTRTCEDDDRRRLELVLLRIHAVVEEAEGRHITNRRMFLQLKALIQGVYLGHYMLDRCKAVSGSTCLLWISSYDVDETTWANFQSYLQKLPGTEIKIVVTGRAEQVANLGTAQPIRLKSLSEEESWYYLKALAFGSMDPDEHPKLASLGMQLATLLQGLFLGANIRATKSEPKCSILAWCIM